MWPGVTMEEQSSSSGAAPTPAPKSKALWIVIAVIVVVVVVLAAAVLGGLFAPTKAHLRIGTLLSLTGGLALFGPGDTKGANLAVEEINKAGGGVGQPVENFKKGDHTALGGAQAPATKIHTHNPGNGIVGAPFSW